MVEEIWRHVAVDGSKILAVHEITEMADDEVLVTLRGVVGRRRILLHYDPSSATSRGVIWSYNPYPSN
jgi:hypothetical protein